MKKYLSLMLAIFLVFAMVACQSDDPDPTDNPSIATPTTKPTTVPTTEPSDNPTTEPEEEPTTEPTAEPTTDPTMEPSTEPATEPTTVPSTEPITEPATEPTTVPTKEPATEPQGTTYILNTNSKKFHYPSCSSVGDMKESNKREYIGTRDEVIAMGYDPCGRCKP